MIPLKIMVKFHEFDIQPLQMQEGVARSGKLDDRWEFNMLPYIIKMNQV